MSFTITRNFREKLHTKIINIKNAIFVKICYELIKIKQILKEKYYVCHFFFSDLLRQSDPISIIPLSDSLGKSLYHTKS